MSTEFGSVVLTEFCGVLLAAPLQCSPSLADGLQLVRSPYDVLHTAFFSFLSSFCSQCSCSFDINHVRCAVVCGLSVLSVSDEKEMSFITNDI